MSDKAIMNKHAKDDRNKGLLIALAASIVLILLAAYKIPVIHNELYGNIEGVSEVHDETGSKIIAAVRLDTGGHVLAYMPRDLQVRTGVKVKVMEGRTILGLKSYKVISYGE
jgi:hypothetical protein